MIHFSHVKSDDIIYVIMPLFDQETLPKDFVIPCQMGTIEESTKKIELMVIQVPYPFPYKSTKYVLWNYNVKVYVVSKPVVLKE